jgi:esterase/lipase
MWRDDYQRVGGGRRQHAVELTHGFRGCPDELRLAAAYLRQQDGRMGNECAGDDAGHGIRLAPSQAPAEGR